MNLAPQLAHEVCASMNYHATIDSKIHIELSQSCCGAQTNTDISMEMTPECSNFTNWINLCRTMSVTCNLGRHGKNMPSRQYSFNIMMYTSIDRVQSSGVMMTGCSMCQCTLTKVDIQRAFNGSQSTPPTSSDGIINFMHLLNYLSLFIKQHYLESHRQVQKIKMVLQHHQLIKVWLQPLCTPA